MSRARLPMLAVVLALLALACSARRAHADREAGLRQAGVAALEGRWQDARAASPEDPWAWAWRPWVEVDGPGQAVRLPGAAAYAPPGALQAPAGAMPWVGDLRARLARPEPRPEPAHPLALLDRLWRDRLWRETRGMAGLPEDGPMQDLAPSHPRVAFACSLQAYVLRPPAPEQHPDAEYAATQRRLREEAEGYRAQAQALAGAAAALLLVLGLWTGLRLRPKGVSST